MLYAVQRWNTHTYYVMLAMNLMYFIRDLFHFFVIIWFVGKERKKKLVEAVREDKR